MNAGLLSELHLFLDHFREYGQSILNLESLYLAVLQFGAVIYKGQPVRVKSFETIWRKR